VVGGSGRHKSRDGLELDMVLGVDSVLDRLYPEAKLISSWGLTQLHYLDIYLQTCVYLKDAGIVVTCNKEDRGNARYVRIE
jgi:hypothetical protein